jgi:hypothetical protein
MKIPSSAASIKYSGQCAEIAAAAPSKADSDMDDCKLIDAAEAFMPLLIPN